MHQGWGCRGVAKRPMDTWWQSEAKAIRVNQDCLKDLYVCAMEPSKYESAPLVAVHTFCEKSQASFDARLVVSPDVCSGYRVVCVCMYVRVCTDLQR